MVDMVEDRFRRWTKEYSIMGRLVDTAARCFDSTNASSGESHLREIQQRKDVERSADKDMNIPSLGHKMAQ
jgi:hypothetical protein